MWLLETKLDNIPLPNGCEISLADTVGIWIWIYEILLRHSSCSGKRARNNWALFFKTLGYLELLGDFGASTDKVRQGMVNWLLFAFWSLFIRLLESTGAVMLYYSWCLKECAKAFCKAGRRYFGRRYFKVAYLDFSSLIKARCESSQSTEGRQSDIECC